MTSPFIHSKSCSKLLLALGAKCLSYTQDMLESSLTSTVVTCSRSK